MKDTWRQYERFGLGGVFEGIMELMATEFADALNERGKEEDWEDWVPMSVHILFALHAPGELYEPDFEGDGLEGDIEEWKGDDIHTAMFSWDDYGCPPQARWSMGQYDAFMKVVDALRVKNWEDSRCRVCGDLQCDRHPVRAMDKVVVVRDGP